MENNFKTESKVTLKGVEFTKITNRNPKRMSWESMFYLEVDGEIVWSSNKDEGLPFARGISFYFKQQERIAKRLAELKALKVGVLRTVVGGDGVEREFRIGDINDKPESTEAWRFDSHSFRGQRTVITNMLKGHGMSDTSAMTVWVDFKNEKYRGYSFDKV